MQHVEEKILAVNVIDVAIVRISPPCRPWIDEFKGVATVLEARLAGYDYASGTKVVALTEVSMELFVGNVPSALASGMSISHRLLRTILPLTRVLCWLLGMLLSIRHRLLM